MISMLQLQAERAPRAASALSEKAAHVANAGTLLRCSSITPFKSKHRCGYPCFYCRAVYEHFDELREHTRVHKTDEIARVLKQSGAESLVVYADITDLKCKLCGQDIPSINELKSHLVKKHDKKIIPDITDRVIPFKIKGHSYICQICSCKFVTFGSVERHMNGHYRNYVCKECGSGYITKYRLKVHHKSMHVDGNYPCECGKTFTTHQKLKNHVNTVHKMMKRFKCTKCPERFAEYFRRQKHLVEAHGLAPLKYTCNVCERTFDRRYTLSRHLKRDHLEERENVCDVCSYRCYTKNELKVHMVKHTGQKIFECTVCKKSYARKKTLREHMRIHNNDRRFVCPACGQAFVQKCSLKGHMKTHHFEYSLP